MHYHKIDVLARQDEIKQGGARGTLADLLTIPVLDGRNLSDADIAQALDRMLSENAVLVEKLSTAPLAKDPSLFLEKKNTAELDRIRNERAKYMESWKRRAVSNKKYEEQKNTLEACQDQAEKQIIEYNKQVVQ